MSGRTCDHALAVALGLLVSCMFVAGCGSGSAAMSNSVTPQSASLTAPLEVNIGDSPSDRVIAFAVTLNSMTLTNSNGGTVAVVSAAAPLEMMRLMGTMQPLAMISIPPGTYTQATMVLGPASVTYMDRVSRLPVQKSVPGMTANLAFNPSVTIGSASPAIMNFDMDMASSVAIDSSGNVTVNPTFSMSMGAFGSGNGQAPENGGMQHLFGAVSGVAGNSFTMAAMQGAPSLTFATNSSTHFQDMSGMGMMANGMLVMVDAVMQTDGSMLAQNVRSVIGSGLMGGGMITGIIGNPATKLTMIAQNGAGSGMMASFLANGIIVTLGTNTAYVIDSDGVDMSGLPFTPMFDATTIFKGQRIHAETGQTTMGGGGGMMAGGGMMVGAMNASEIDLEQQGFSGTVSGYVQSGSQATFNLNLAPDCAFTTLTGASSLTVFQQPGTMLVGMNAIANGNTVHARGLVFLDGGVYKMVSSRIMAP